MADNDQQWERGLIEKLAMAALKEQRRARLWGIFWKLLTFSYLTVVILLAVDWKDSGEKSGRHTALIEIKGLITPGADASMVVTSAAPSSTCSKLSRINSSVLSWR